MATFGWQHLGGTVGGRCCKKRAAFCSPRDPRIPGKWLPEKTGSISPGRGPKCVGVLGCSGPPHSLDGPQAPQPARASQEAMGYAWPHLNPKRRVPPPLAGPPGRDPEPPPQARFLGPGLQLSVPTRIDRVDDDPTTTRRRRRRCTVTTLYGDDACTVGSSPCGAPCTVALKKPY